MADIVHALLIEDYQAETRLFFEHLREAPGGDRFDICIAPTLGKGLTHLEEHATELVFLDLGLPDSQGLETYEAVRRVRPRLPVIILSGVHDEELAVRAVKAGAQDYLFKGEVMGTLIVRAARYAMERAKAEQALRDSEAAFRRAQAVAHVGSWTWHIHTDKLEWSDEMFRIFGVDKAGFSGRLDDIVAQAVHPEDRAAVEKSNLSVAREGKPIALEYRVIRPDGTVRTVWAEAGELIRDANEKPAVLTGIVQDITEHKQAEAAVRASELRYRRLFESAQDGILILEAETGRIMDVNPYLIELLGFTHEQISDKKVWELGFFRDIIANRDNFRELQRENYIRYDDLPLETSDGRKIEVEFVSNIYDVGGQKVIQCNIRNITERKHTQTKIRSLARFPAENPAPVLRIDSAGLLIYANQAAYKFIDDEMEIGKRVPDFLSGATTDALEDNIVKTFEIKCDQYIYSLTAVPFHDAGYVNLYGFDITERKKAEVALRALTRRQETLLAAVPEIVMEVNTQKVYTWTNQAGLDFFGADVIGREAAYYFAGEQTTYDDVQPLFDGLRDDGYVESFQRRRDGEIRLLAWHCRSLMDENGAITGTLSSARDITEEKKLQAEILKLNADLEQRVEERTVQLKNANRELEAFAYSVSHDLRAPLRAIDGFTEILLEDYEASLDAEGKRICSVICENTRRMGQLIDDLLAFSRLGKTQMSRSHIDMKKAARRAYEESVPPDGRKRIDFRVSALPSVPGDLAMIRQVWANLISNAVKFSSKRERAAVSVSGETADTMAVYCVRDNGTGFDMRHADKLFGVFQRLHGRTEFEGTGVGLAIVKRIVERHGGRVWAESTPDQGAAFYFSLPPETNQTKGAPHG
jgi:PAS domain S-box-containing protein